MYPEDTAANLNAANTAMQKGDLKNAEHYLRKAGESPEALYARGAYAMLTEEYETAAGYPQEAEKAGIREAREALEQLQKRNKNKTSITSPMKLKTSFAGYSFAEHSALVRTKSPKTATSPDHSTGKPI